MGNRYSTMQPGGQWATLSSAAVWNVFLLYSVCQSMGSLSTTKLSSHLSYMGVFPSLPPWHYWHHGKFELRVCFWFVLWGLFLFCVGLLAFFERKELLSYSNELIFNLFVSLVSKFFIHNIDLIQSHLQNLITSGNDNMLIIHKLALCKIFL